MNDKTNDARVEAVATFLFDDGNYGDWRKTSELARDGFRDWAKRILAAADAAEQAAPVAVPAGYWLAPDEPTAEMIRCADTWDDGFGGAWFRARAAALAASPQAPAAPVAVPAGPVDLRALAEQSGISMDCWDMGAASLAYSEGCHGITRAHLEKFAGLVGFECWNRALESSPKAMRSFLEHALAASPQAAPAPAVQGEPVGWLHESGQFQPSTPYMSPEAKASFKAPKWQPLYTQPSPQAQTDEREAR